MAILLMGTYFLFELLNTHMIIINSSTFLTEYLGNKTARLETFLITPVSKIGTKSKERSAETAVHR